MRQKRYYVEDAIYFVTTKTKENYPYFRNTVLTKLCIDKIRLAKEVTDFWLFGYVVISDHVHILIQPKGKYTISKIMHYIKRNTARSANILIINHDVGEGDHPRLRFGWQSSFHDNIIRNEGDLFTHVDYIRYNPIKHGQTGPDGIYPYVFIDHQLIGRYYS